MIGKRLLIIGCVISLHARQYHVPINQQRTTHQNCTANIELHAQSCLQREPVSFTCQFHGPRDAVSDVKLLWDRDEPHMYIYPHPHVSDNTHMRTWSWSGVWYPQTPGQHRLPQMHITYTYERRRKGRSGMMGSLWGGFSREQKEMRVPCPHVVTVAPLPDAGSDADVIGSFGSCRWIDVPEKIQAGTTCEIGLEINGAGSFPELQPPEVSVPDGCSCFYVGTKMEHPVHAYQVTFLYAIYAHTPGAYVCDVNGWTVYDPERDDLYKLHPGQLEIAVVGDDVQQQCAEETPLPEENSQDHIQTSRQQAPTISTIRTMTIPPHIILLCSLFPITIAGGRIGVYAMRWWRCRTYTYRAVKRSFANAKKAAKRPAYHTPHDLYCNMLHVFHALAEFTGMRDHIIQQHIDYYIPEYADEWHDFWYRLQAAVFSDREDARDNTIYTDAYAWISLLHRRWRRMQKEGAV